MERRSLWWSQGARSSSWPREQACDRAEERATALDDHRHHVDHAPGIVVTYAAALHRRLLLAGERFLTLIDLALHMAKIRNNQLPDKETNEKAHGRVGM
jgi:hypothetical protein